MISETEKIGIINNDGFLINKILSISLAFFIISNILTASTVAFATSSSSSSSSTTATSNTISYATVNNINNIEKKQSQPPLQQQPKTHEYTLIARDTTLQIAPSVRVDAWTYNGTIPGPTLTATEGDRVIIHFINKTPLPHTVHLHGDHPSEQDGVFEQISANGTYTYDFIATPAGALMYHCHVSPVMQHVRMGLYGAFIIYPKEPLPPAREYVLVDGEYDMQNQLNPFPEYYMFNGYVEQYFMHPLPARTNETVRIYLINLGLSPAYSMHIHGTLFKAYPSGIWKNSSPLMVQSWEVGSGNAAIFEMKWPWPGKFTFHFHGVPEERGAMGYFNVTNSPVNVADGKDVATTKSISMIDWQANLTKSLQKENPNGVVTTTATAKSANEMEEMEQPHSNMNEVSIVKGATTLGDKAYSPSLIKIKVGSTIAWTNNDNIMHTVTSSTPDAPDVGGAFDSGLTTFITLAKTYSHKFTDVGEFSYYCRVHPTMIGKIVVVP